MSATASIHWVDPARELPDDETTVLLALENGEVEPGFHYEDGWRYLSAESVDSPVLFWADYPKHPTEAP